MQGSPTVPSSNYLQLLSPNQKRISADHTNSLQINLAAKWLLMLVYSIPILVTVYTNPTIYVHFFKPQCIVHKVGVLGVVKKMLTLNNRLFFPRQINCTNPVMKIWGCCVKCKYIHQSLKRSNLISNMFQNIWDGATKGWKNKWY